MIFYIFRAENKEVLQKLRRIKVIVLSNNEKIAVIRIEVIFFMIKALKN